MAVYVIAQLKFTCRELYDRYQSRFVGVFRKFRGKLLTDEHSAVLEGAWPCDKFVIKEFTDDAAAQENPRIAGNIRRSESTAKPGPVLSF